MRNDAQFERCIDFLVRMIEKYGDEVSRQIAADKLYDCQENATWDSQKEDLEVLSDEGSLSA